LDALKVCIVAWRMEWWFNTQVDIDVDVGERIIVLSILLIHVLAVGHCCAWVHDHWASNTLAASDVCID